MFGDGCGLSLNVTDDNYVNKFNMPKEKLPCFDDKGFEKEIEGRIRAELLYNTKFGVPRVPCTSIETCPNVLELNKLIAKTPKNKNSIISEWKRNNKFYTYSDEKSGENNSLAGYCLDPKKADFCEKSKNAIYQITNSDSNSSWALPISSSSEPKKNNQNLTDCISKRQEKGESRGTAEDLCKKVGVGK